MQSAESSVIKADLDYVLNNWNSPCCDLWEEVYGFHFFTRLVLTSDSLFIEGSIPCTR